MDLKQLEALVCVAEEGSFSRAAQRLHLTQPTVSSRIGSLEQELGVRLLQRPTPVLTEAGELLCRQAREMLALRDQALRAIQGLSRQVRGTVSVAASTVPGQYFLPKLLQAFRGPVPGCLL